MTSLMFYLTIVFVIGCLPGKPPQLNEADRLAYINGTKDKRDINYSEINRARARAYYYENVVCNNE